MSGFVLTDFHERRILPLAINSDRRFGTGMFQTLVTIATLIATSAHALIGCCWHHEHAHYDAGCQTEPKAVVHDECACHHQDANEIAATEPAPCGHSGDHDSDECEGRCQFLTNAKVELPSLDRPNLSAGWLPTMASDVSPALEHSGLATSTLAASLLSGSLCVRDLTQIARI
jgi:hypothetical protein